MLVPHALGYTCRVPPAKCCLPEHVQSEVALCHPCMNECMTHIYTAARADEAEVEKSIRSIRQGTLMDPLQRRFDDLGIITLQGRLARSP